ncbi:MAG: OmpA family protein [Saprospiraceae bacterium]
MITPLLPAKWLSYFLILFFTANVVAQDPVSFTTSPLAAQYYRDGEIALLNKNFKKARQLFTAALKDNPEFVAAQRALAVTYEALRDYKQAADTYREIFFLAPQFSRAMYYEAAQAHYKAGYFTKALDFFKQYERLQKFPIEEFGYNGTKELANEQKYVRRLAGDIVATRISIDSFQYSSVKEVFNLGKNINTEGDEYFPFLSNDRKTIFYTQRRNEKADEDLFVAKIRGTAWSNGNSVSISFNTKENEGMTTLVRDGRTVFFTACGREEVKGSCDIWTGEVRGTKINKEAPLTGYSNSDRWDSQAAISCDGRLLFFASNREGGFGGTDIWMSKREQNGEWGIPTNLGDNVNTPDDEEAPFITNDGKTLYFSSTGHLGMGEQDIFMVQRTDEGAWSVPFNLGAPVNTPHRELGFFLAADGKVGYFASNRPEGMGGMDIYSFELSEQLYNDPITLVEGFVKDSTYKLPVATTLYVKDGEPIVTDKLGRFFICLPAKEFLEFEIREGNFLPYQRKEMIPEWDNRTFYQLDILLQDNQMLVKAPEPLAEKVAPVEPQLTEEREPFVPEEEEEIAREKETILATNKFQYTIYYDFDRSSLTRRVLDELDNFLGSVKRSNIVKVEVVGYADYIGEEVYNMMLSEKRAKSVALYITNTGISVDDMYIEGRGEVLDGREPKENRRVDVVIHVKEN